MMLGSPPSVPLKQKVRMFITDMGWPRLARLLAVVLAFGSVGTGFPNLLMAQGSLAPSPERDRITSANARADTIFVASKAELEKALLAAKGGETIQMGPGEYGRIDLHDLNYATEVTVRSDQRSARFMLLNIVNCRNLSFDGITVDLPSNEGSSVVQIKDSRNISFRNSEVHALVDSVTPIEGPHFGIFVNGSASDIEIVNNYVHDVVRGIVVYGSKNLTVRDNQVDRVGEDAFVFSGLKGAVIEGNVGPTNFYPKSGAHCDFMQFTSGADDVIVRDNLLLLGGRLHMQGIFMNGGVKGGAFNDILIENNLIYTAMLNGIFVSAGRGIVIRRNIILNATGSGSKASVVRIKDVDADVSDNIWTNTRGVAVGSNIVLQNVDSSRPNYVGHLIGAGRRPSLSEVQKVIDVYGREGIHHIPRLSRR